MYHWALFAEFLPKLWHLHKVQRSVMVTKRRPKVLFASALISAFHLLLFRPIDTIHLLVNNPPSYAESPRFSIPFRALGTLLPEIILVKLRAPFFCASVFVSVVRV